MISLTAQKRQQYNMLAPKTARAATRGTGGDPPPTKIPMAPIIPVPMVIHATIFKPIERTRSPLYG